MAKIAVSLQEKVLYNIDEVAALLGIGRDLVYRFMLELDVETQKPLLYSVRLGRRRLVSRKALELFLERMGE